MYFFITLGSNTFHEGELNRGVREIQDKESRNTQCHQWSKWLSSGADKYSQHGRSVMLEGSERQGCNPWAGIGMSLCNRLRIVLAK